MVELDGLLKLNESNHRKLLALVGDNPAQKKKIISYLKEDDWKAYDVEAAVLELIDNIPENKVHLRIASKIKKWIDSLERRIILTNVNILYSPELDKINPIGAFEYKMRGDREAVLFLEGVRLKNNKAIYSTPDREDYCEMSLENIVYEKIEDVIVGGNN